MHLLVFLYPRNPDPAQPQRRHRLHPRSPEAQKQQRDEAVSRLAQVAIQITARRRHRNRPQPLDTLTCQAGPGFASSSAPMHV